ncbi:hypothetical protein FC34_GL001593 [Lacticaseibacillus brantae DSM 23927]|uniref:Fluoride-specific ion channel FluC n=2 Tax=Lacticaseibacillus brantae TaxID=943673 RepID=A0A0R2B5Z3_9LACO|nr:hypothetical protein FC34_GL001593 [Lacticaseibacillus brantae DSM 23927]
MVAGGAAVGAVARYVLTQVGRMYQNRLPWATFGINISGSFVIGLLAGLQLPQLLGLLLMTGFCGGYTTFSTYNTELVILLRDRQIVAALTYFFGSVVSGLIAVSLGLCLGNYL